MKVIGVTGSSGAGKSTVCKLIEEKYDVKIINADKVAKKLAAKGTEYLKTIEKNFGANIIDENGELKRKELAEIIYNDDEKREKLNKCTFPYICEEIRNEIKLEKNEETIIIDAPLLFESGLNKSCDVVIGVISNKKMQIERISKREGITYEEAEKRIKAQVSNEFCILNCDEIIENNDDLFSIQKKVESLAKKYNITERLQ